jgi:hypothetical protein
MVEQISFLAREVYLDPPWPMQGDREVIGIELRRWKSGKMTYHLIGAGRTSGEDISREVALGLKQQSGGIGFTIDGGRQVLGEEERQFLQESLLAG